MARLVAKGYTQNYGAHYFDTFTLVANMNMIKIIIALVAQNYWNSHQSNVNKCFLT